MKESRQSQDCTDFGQDRQKLLTCNIDDQNEFEEYRKKLSKELGISVEVRKTTKIHDRFLIFDQKCWSVGTSIKDLGNKDTIVKDISEVFSTMNDLFEMRCNEPE